MSSLDGSQPECCEECGFDSARWKGRDVGDLFGALGWWWREATSGVSPEILSRRPEEGVWSVLEYGAHSVVVTAVNRYGAELILDQDGVELPDVPAGDDAGPDSHQSRFDLEPVLNDLAREGDRLAGLCRERNRSWTNLGFLPAGERIQAAALVGHAAHDASHHMLDVSRGLSGLGAAPTGEGAVVQLNRSGGGVPKSPVDRVEVGWAGVVGDRQADDKHHGRPFQAVCLWSAEVIDALAAEGHPIGAGSAGENLTVSGLAWDQMRPGAVLEVGSCRLEVSFPAVPCAKQSRWFSDGDFNRISHDDHPGWARWYAWVRGPGSIDSGDRVVMGRWTR